MIRSARHLYIHVPFCARRCSYCDFSIAVRSVTPVEDYLRGLRTELAQIATREPDSDALETVYLGGGTPSRLGGAGVAAVLTSVRQRWVIAPAAEVTVEANPDDVNDIAVATWAAAGFNRVSLGAQSFDDAALKWMHRTHDSAQIGRAVATLRRGGIDDISLDLIFALPDHLPRSWTGDIQRAIDLEPAHVSLYGLTVEPRTPLARWADRGQIVEGGEERYEQEFLTAHDMMAAAGFEHYEVSNFSLPTRRSRHNSGYWTGVPYLAAGPSAHSFDGAARRWNVSAYGEWLRRLDKGEPVIAGEEILTPENRRAEAIYLALRTTGGVHIDHDERHRAQLWQRSGWAVVDQHCLRLTPRGWLRLDSLAADLAAHRLREPAVA